MKEIRITRHAKNRMRGRGIEKRWVEETVEHPELEEPLLEGMTNRWRTIGQGALRVTCREEPDQLVIISVVLRKGIPQPKEGR